MESVYFMVYSSRDKHPEHGTFTELSFNKGAEYNLLSKSVINSAALIRALLAALISNFYNRIEM